MNLQQLRYVRETVRQGLNLTGAANALFTSQPGVSKQIRELELELGVDIFERRGKRFVAVTEPGQRIVAIAERVLQELDNLRQIGKDFADPSAGNLTIATTHTQARYALPQVVAAFRRRYPGVRLQLLQGNPTAIAQMVMRGEADIGIATEALDHFPELAALPGYRWHHVVVVPVGHALAERAPLALPDLARYPIITYSPEFTGRSSLSRTVTSRRTRSTAAPKTGGGGGACGGACPRPSDAASRRASAPRAPTGAILCLMPIAEPMPRAASMGRSAG